MRIFFYQEQGNADCFGKELIGKTEIKFSLLVLRNNLEKLLSWFTFSFRQIMRFLLKSVP